MKDIKDIKELEGIEIFLGYKCNINCNFCYQKDLRLEYKDNIEKSKVLKLLEEGYNNGKKFVIFSGGEPTLDINLGYYIEYSKKLGFEHIRVHTNGFGFKDYKYLESLYLEGLTGITISIHGYKNIHDKITKSKGSFKNILRALINFEKIKKIDNNFVVDTNTVLCNYNSTNLFLLFKLLLKFNISRRMIVYPYNINLEKQKLINILPYKDNYLKEVEKISKYFLKNKINNFVLETIPYCIMKRKYWEYIEKNYKTDKQTYYIDGEKDKNLQYYIGKVKFKECSQCLKNNECYGFSEDYYKLYGKPNFNPITI